MAVAIGGALGCEPSAAPRRWERPAPPPGAHVEQLEPGSFADDAPALGDTQPPPTDVPREVAPAPIERAPATDTEFDSDEPIEVRRYVYRVQLNVPETLGVDRSDIAIPAAELYVDVSLDRLRARFVGPGWPVAAGSEIRVRGDSPGVYVFDAEGGRSLAPGGMAEWFEGGPTNRTGPPLVVRRDPQSARVPRDPSAPGPLVCALLAEWAGERRENVMRRCDPGAPIGFRVGFWRGERTAEVPVEVPRRALRADEVDAPDPVAPSTSRAFLDPGALSRLPRMEHPPAELDAPEGTAPAEGLEFVNESEARVVVTVEGVAVGWVGSGARGTFVGMAPGLYRIAALRPLGAVVIRPRIVPRPGTTTLRTPHRRTSDEPR